MRLRGHGTTRGGQLRPLDDSRQSHPTRGDLRLAKDPPGDALGRAARGNSSRRRAVTLADRLDLGRLAGVAGGDRAAIARTPKTPRERIAHVESRVLRRRRRGSKKHFCRVRKTVFFATVLSIVAKIGSTLTKIGSIFAKIGSMLTNIQRTRTVYGECPIARALGGTIRSSISRKSCRNVSRPGEATRDFFGCNGTQDASHVVVPDTFA